MINLIHKIKGDATLMSPSNRLPYSLSTLHQVRNIVHSYEDWPHEDSSFIQDWIEEDAETDGSYLFQHL